MNIGLVSAFGVLASSSLLSAQPLSPSGQNCTFRNDPDGFLLREERARAGVRQRVSKLRPDLARAVAGAGSAVPIRNYIDDQIFSKLRESGVASAALSTDGEFVRRIYLDLTGRLPSPAQVREFVSSDSAAKRDAAIDSLLKSTEFADRWTMWLGDLVQNSRTAANTNQQVAGRNAMYTYLRDVAKGKSFADFAVELVTAKGNIYDSGAANFPYRSRTANGPPQDTYDLMLVRSASAFLGLGYYDCLLCHNGRGHLEALSLWGTRTPRLDAYRMAAYFSRLQLTARPPGGDYANSFDVADASDGAYSLETAFGNRPNRTPIGSNNTVTPAYREGEEDSGGAWREGFAKRMVKDPMFARNLANRLWKQMFTLALVEPVDGLDPARLDPGNPPEAPWTLQATHPELLEKLAQSLRDNNYNLRETLRLIAQSSAYQLSSRYEGEWDINSVALFARHYPRRLESEEIHDAIVQATGVMTPLRVQGWADPVMWAYQLPDVEEPNTNDGNARNFLNVFLRGNRDTQPRVDAASILQQLMLMNDPFVTGKVRVGASPVLGEIAKIASNGAAADELFLRFLGRSPNATEKRKAVQLLASSSRDSAIEDLAWALINKVDFLFSY